MSPTNEAAPAPRVPDPWSDHPPAARFKTLHGYEESGYETQEQWKAYIRSAAVREAFGIWVQASDLLGKLKEFGKKHGTADPGAAAIVAAGLPLPARVKQYGTKAGDVGGDFEGFAWVLNEFCEKLDYYCIDPDEWDADGLAIIPPDPQ